MDQHGNEVTVLRCVLTDRLKGKRRDGTPDKSATPSQEAQDENRPPSRQIIWDEEIEQLQIKAEELDKVRGLQEASVVFLSCPLEKKHADLAGSFLY